MNHHRFEFAPIRYVHDTVLDESLNVGVAVFVRGTGEFLIEIDEAYHRLAQAFPGFSGSSYRRSVRELHAAASTLAKSIRHARQAEGDLFGKGSGLESLSAAIDAAIPDAGLTIRIGRIGSGLTPDPTRELEALFQRFVKSNQLLQVGVRRSDAEVWGTFKKKVQARALNWLTPRQVRTHEVDLHFDHTFINGKIHAVQPLSFDYLKTETIAQKAARWVGFGVSLDASGEMSKVYFVLGKPSEVSGLRAYGRAKDFLDRMPLAHELIEEDEAPEFERELLGARAKYWKDDEESGT